MAEFETDKDRLDILKELGAEEFNAGKADNFWAIFRRENFEADFGSHRTRGMQSSLEARTSDLEAHEVVSGAVVVRVADGEQYTCRDLEPDALGMTIIRLAR